MLVNKCSGKKTRGASHNFGVWLVSLIAQVRHDCNHSLTSSQGNHGVYIPNNIPTAGISLQILCTLAALSYDQLSSFESQPTTMRSSDAYVDDPEFQRLSQDLMTKLFA